MISRPKAWLLAARPKTLPASIGPVLLGISLADIELIYANYLVAALTFLCALLLQISTNLVNDYYDSIRGLDDKNRLGPERALQMGWINASELKKGFSFTLFTSFLIGIYLMMTGGLPIIIIGLLSILMAYAYTGGPLPLSYYGLGEILALIFFGPIPVWGSYFLITNDHSFFPAVIGLIPGSISMGLMGINNLRDHANDREKGKRTLATIFGTNFQRYLILFSILFSIAAPFLLYIHFQNILFIFTIIPGIIFIKTWKRIYFAPINKELNNDLANTGKYLFLNCLIVSIAFFNS